MSEYVTAKKSKLSFKGVTEKKKRKKTLKDDQDVPMNKKRTETDEEFWVPVESKDDIFGPLFITIKGNDTSVCLLYLDDGTVEAKALPLEEPVDITQVIVAQPVVKNTLAFKNAHGKYLSCDPVGVIKCEKDAIGPQEEWSVILRDDGVGFLSVHNSFLKVDIDSLVVRGDSSGMGFQETFNVKIQAPNKHSARVKDLEEKRKAQDLNKQLPQDEVMIEQELVRKYQSWQNNRIQYPDTDARELKQAKESGRLHEALLDRRSKLKHDKFCY